MNRVRSPWILWFLSIVMACRHEAVRQPVELLATPAAAATNLPQRVVEEFTRETATPVTLRILTAEQIEQAAMAKEVVAMFSDSAHEAALAQSGGLRLSSILAVEKFVVAGPDRDPAGARSASSAAKALQRVAQHKRAFCSPVDVPALHNRELELWSQAQTNPEDNRRYRRCSGTGADVLEKCVQLQAYTVTSPEILSSARFRHLDSLSAITTNYIVALYRPSGVKASRNAAWLIEWLMSYRGREIVRSVHDKDGLPVLAPSGR